MPKQGQRADFNNFIQGLVSEASPLNFPPNACVEEENWVFNRDGTLRRRFGMDFEEDYAYRSLGVGPTLLPTNAISSFRWLAPGGDVESEYIVIQVGGILYIYDSAITPLSSDGFIGTVNIFGSLFAQKFSFASVNGRLIVAYGGSNFIIVTRAVVGTLVLFNFEFDSIKVRDVWGIEETENPRYETDNSYRSTVGSDVHNYNLSNQSWGIARKNDSGTLVDPIQNYFITLGLVPSNSEQVWAGLQFQASATPFERMYPNLYEEVIGAAPSSAKGYFIIDLINRGATRREAFNTNKTKYPAILVTAAVPDDTSAGGLSAVADFAGRVFYGGFDGTIIAGGDKRSPDLSNIVAFSQLVRSRQDFAKCYQEGDPTSRDSADVVDTDGGFIKISGAKQIIAMRNLQTHLVIFATNGVFTVTGGSDYGFSATNYKVSKISTFGALNASSIVVEGTSAYFWAEDGIYTLARNQFGDYEVQSMTLKSIQSFYQNIPTSSKATASGAYDPSSKKVVWVYKEGTPFTTSSVTREIVFDSLTGSFSVNRIVNLANSSVEVFAPFRGPTFVVDTSDDPVVVGGVVVQASGVDVIVSTDLVTATTLQSMRYIAIANVAGILNFTFSTYKNTRFLDWEAKDLTGVDAKAFALTGWATAGDSAIDKQAPYLVWHMRRTENGLDINGDPINQSSCLVRARWDFANRELSYKWTPLFQSYRYVKAFIPLDFDSTYDNGYELITTKNKLRGRGRALAIYFETEPGKDCQIVGWNLTLNGNSIT